MSTVVRVRRRRLIVCLCMPSAVLDLAPVLLALLERHLRLPLGDVDGVDVASWFDAEACAGASSWKTFDCGYIDVFASVELESWFCARNLQVDLAFWVVE